jgi:GNAT superfamily N-acetyltransferase
MDPTRFNIGQVTITQMTRREVDVAVDWARREGWNPGVHDAECFYHTDPEGFYAAKLKGEIVGTISIVKYGSFAFMGFIIVRPDLRKRGIGSLLYRFMEGYEKYSLGLDGVLDMQAIYERLGFRLAHKNRRYRGTAKARRFDECTPISEGEFDEILAFDANCFFAPRPTFLRRWLFQKDTYALKIRDTATQRISGYGVIRKCFEGYKIGPLFAETQREAEELLDSLMSKVPGATVFLDAPEPNAAAVALAENRGMQVTFATARMYTKQAPALPLDKIYGITSFELG